MPALFDPYGQPMPDVPRRLVPPWQQQIAPGFEMLPMPPPVQARTEQMATPPPASQLSPPWNAAERAADAMMPQSAPLYPPPASPYRFPSPASASNPLEWLGGAVQDVADDPWRAIEGGGASAGLALGAGAGLFDAASNVFRGPRRAFTEAESNAFRSARRRTDVEISRQPPHAVQGRNPDGTFRPFTEAQRVERERGIGARAQDQISREAAVRRAVDDAEISARQKKYMQDNWGGQTLPEEPSRELLDIWKGSPKPPFRPY